MMGLKGDTETRCLRRRFEEDHRAHGLQQHAGMSFGWRRASHFVICRFQVA